MMQRYIFRFDDIFSEGRIKSSISATLLCCFAMFASAACFGDEVDSLIGVDGINVDSIGIAAGVEARQFASVSLAPCTVSFKDEWRERQNRGRMPVAHRVSERDETRLRDDVMSLCDEVFRSKIDNHHGIELAADAADAGMVLTLAISDLELAAPAINPVGVARTFTAESGKMTLTLAGHDTQTGELLLSLVDERRDLRSTRLELADRVANRRDIQQLLGFWAESLIKAMATVTDGSPKASSSKVQLPFNKSVSRRE